MRYLLARLWTTCPLLPPDVAARRDLEHAPGLTANRQVQRLVNEEIDAGARQVGCLIADELRGFRARSSFSHARPAGTFPCPIRQWSQTAILREHSEATQRRYAHGVRATPGYVA